MKLERRSEREDLYTVFVTTLGAGGAAAAEDSVPN
eukprot:CAMPEP_0118662506 /NCGR_PEP_ID=MMETSP0785-20121206/16870_1 /TAXON_ID=91992 /ORGANISM="Bolidomonas pacifica, Strain CCMP 1866" /LENGTH=34 /DNA_ID= /DNA_START= /DNA_END= /DNA_ORIENTATION=